MKAALLAAYLAAAALPPAAAATEVPHMLLYDFDTGFAIEGVEARDVAISLVDVTRTCGYGRSNLLTP